MVQRPLMDERVEVPDGPPTFAMERAALEMVRSGSMLPADGLYYTANREDDLLVRRKCDGKLIGRIAASELGSPVSVGSAPILGG